MNVITCIHRESHVNKINTRSNHNYKQKITCQNRAGIKENLVNPLVVSYFSLKHAEPVACWTLTSNGFEFDPHCR